MEDTTTETRNLDESSDHRCDQETLDNLYSCAWNLYQRKKLEEANVLFQYLCLLQPLNKDYQMGLGATYQLTNQYHRAIEVYMAAAALAGNDYRPLLQLGYCHLMIKKNVQARECFEEVYTSTRDPQLKLTAQGYLSAMENSPAVNH